MGAIIQAVISYIWLFAVLVLLWRIAISYGKRQDKLQDALIEATQQSAEAARKAASTAELLTTYLERKP